MNVSRDEAAAALDSIELAGHHARTARGYADAAPFFVLWGAIWFAANLVTYLEPRWGGRAWLGGIGVGTLLTVLLSVRQGIAYKRRFRPSVAESRAFGRQASLLGVAIMAWFPALFLVLGPLSGRQTNALISLTWAFIYMAAGAFRGWRLFLIGAVTAAATVFGYLFLQQHYPLWMALVGGGSLIAGGLWLRKL